MTIEVNPNKKDLETLVQKIAESAGYKDSRMMHELVRLTTFLTQKDCDLVFKMLGEIKASGGRSSELLRSIWQLDFERKPVSISQFVEDPYYLGRTLYKKGQHVVFAKWREELDYVCDPNSSVVEWVLTGSIGCGKTFTSSIALLYKGVYWLSCLKCPQEYFLLEENSEIVFGLFNATLGNASSVDFGRIMSFVDSCSYFRENCPRVPAKRYIYFPSKRIAFREGSNFQHVLGADMFGLIMDEANFMKEQKDKERSEQQAYQIYHHAVSRMQSRFLRFGVMPGLFCIASSKKHKTSFLEDHMRENRRNPRLHVSDYSIWDVKGRNAFSSVEFRVAAGNRFSRTRILDEVDLETHQIIKADPAPIGQDIVSVPIDFYPQFKKNPNVALRDIAGYATETVNPLIHNVESVHWCVNPERPHPFKVETAKVSVLRQDQEVMNYINWSKLVRVEKGFNVPIHHPGEPRYVHVDLAINGDAAGIAMVCGYNRHSIVDHDPVTGQTTERFVPKVHVDFMLRIVPEEGDEIDIGKITTFLINLKNFGFHLHRVTFDGYQSRNAIQNIRKAAILPKWNKIQGRFRYEFQMETDVQSVDRKPTAYELLRDLMLYRCIDYYQYRWFLEEVVHLEVDQRTGKVDHPEGGSKDVSDALAGACFNVSVARNRIVIDPDLDAWRGAPGEPHRDLAAELDRGVVEDYVDKDRVVSVVPSPLPGRSARMDIPGTKRGDFLKNLKRELRKQSGF